MSTDTRSIVLGGGCFWCTEAVLARVPWTLSVVPGYAGGESPAPSYQSVCSGRTGHAEVVRVVYDPSLVSLPDLLAVFFRSHDPTTLNRQGADVGTQYRSVVLAESEDDLAVTREFIESLRSVYTAPIVTQTGLLTEFHEAEEEHHRYFERHPEQAYCALVIAPKIEKAFGKISPIV